MNPLRMETNWKRHMFGLFAKLSAEAVLINESDECESNQACRFCYASTRDDQWPVAAMAQ